MSTPERELEPAEALRAEREAEREAEIGGEIRPEIGGEARPGIATGIATEGDPEGSAVPTNPESPPAEVAIGFSPRQVLGGFALLAAIVVWLFRRRKH